MERRVFVKEWAASLDRGSASVFVGAGLSRRANYPSWSELLKSIAAELGLDIESEYDLAGLAQYSLNRNSQNRNRLSKLIVEHFPPKPAPEPFQILARLPLRHVWTTNYDELIEAAWRANQKLLAVKSINSDLTTEIPWAHTVLYKMHGSVTHPTNIVIAKDDYELYRRTRPGFLQVLTAHLVSRQILFLGFSFTDPNLSHLFAVIRETFEEAAPTHYAIVKRPTPVGNSKSAKRRYETDKIRHLLWTEDLRRYGIHAVEIDRYEEIDDILLDVERILAQKNVFVSGSFPERGPISDRHQIDFIERVARHVGIVITERGKRLITGFGLVVGRATISGALETLSYEEVPNLEKHLLVRPFPQTVPAGLSQNEFNRIYREGLISQSGTCVFISGVRENKIGDPTSRVVASGSLEEFEIAHNHRRGLIPIASTGGAAQQIWNEIDRDFGSYMPKKARKHFNTLKTSRDPSEIAGAVDSLINLFDSST